MLRFNGHDLKELSDKIEWQEINSSTTTQLHTSTFTSSLLFSSYRERLCENEQIMKWNIKDLQADERKSGARLWKNRQTRQLTKEMLWTVVYGGN